MSKKLRRRDYDVKKGKEKKKQKRELWKSEEGIRRDGKSSEDREKCKEGCGVVRTNHRYSNYVQPDNENIISALKSNFVCLFTCPTF